MVTRVATVPHCVEPFSGVRYKQVEEDFLPPGRTVRNYALFNSKLIQVQLGHHKNMMLRSLDDTILTSSSDSVFTGTGVEILMEAGEDLFLYGDQAGTLSVQAQTINGARLRVVTW